MTNNGLSKLTEECGELQQVIGKLLQYPMLQTNADKLHPDGTHLRSRLCDEIADVVAAIDFVIAKMQLDAGGIAERRRAKVNRFWHWDAGHGV
jgi:NTP pyrophosphatase (non-canonical NTP hydrolase)